MEIAVPPGVHRVEVALTNTPVRSAANAISLASLAVLAMLSLRFSIGRSRGR
jgi:hypothetical protein